MFCLNSHIREENENTTTNNINSNSNSFAWYSWEPSTSFTLINAFQTAAEGPSAAAAGPHQQQPPLYGGEGSHVHPDPHLTCLKLGKRHYFEDTNNNNNNNNVANAASLGERHVGSVGGGELFALEGDKRAKGYYGGGAGGEKTAAAFTVPRCQVEGCHVALVNAKEYHRRHKVCEVHSKTPKVVVLGREQRFCQQCSR